MIQTRDGSRFGEIGIDISRIVDQVSMGNFNGNVTLQLFVISLVNNAKASFSQNALNLVTPD